VFSNYYYSLGPSNYNFSCGNLYVRTNLVSLVLLFRTTGLVSRLVDLRIYQPNHSPLVGWCLFEVLYRSRGRSY